MKSQRIIGLTGGIGCGKSIVRDIAYNMGIPVYDCDSRAKMIMDTDEEIIQAIADNICPEAVTDGVIDRAVLGARVFSCDVTRRQLNNLVHAVVKKDVMDWVCGKQTAIVESAILYTSGLNDVVTEDWEVIAPMEIRIERLRKRNPNLSSADIQARIDSQLSETNHPLRNPDYTIVNDNLTPVLPQVERLLDLNH